MTEASKNEADRAELQRFVLNENIQHFRRRLAATPDAATRARLEGLVAAAERELAVLSAELEGVRQPWQAIPAEEAQEARARMTVWFRNTYGASPALAALIDPAPGLAMVAVNATYEQATGLTEQEMADQPLFVLFPDNPNDPAANGVSNLYRSLRQVAESGRPHAMDLQRYDTQDAQGVWATRYWRPVNSALLDDQGRLVFLLNLVEEATDEVLAAGAEG